jgi:PAS domain-containing protein
MRQADGRVGGVAQFSIDVTKEVEARQAAGQISEEQIAILDQLPCGVIVVDRDGYVIKMNDAGRRMVPWDGAARTRPSKLLELRDPSTGGELAETARPLVRALKGERVAETDCVGVVLATGERLPIRVSAAPLFDDKGGVRGAIAVFTSMSGD